MNVYNSLTPETRIMEVAQILAAGILRAVKQTEKSRSSEIIPIIPLM